VRGTYNYTRESTTGGVAVFESCRILPVGGRLWCLDGAAGEEIAWGYSRETDESALAKRADDDPRLTTATIYSSVEPNRAARAGPGHGRAWG
jgi:hypothetical protein